MAAIKFENIGKQYNLGAIGSGSLSSDLNRLWARIRGKEDPLGRIEQYKVSESDNGSVWALKDINFDIQPGEVVGFIGKNGAGKSTLLKLLSNVTGPTTGQIKVRGKVSSLLEVGTGFHPELTGRENIFLNGAILGMSRYEIKSKFDEIVEFSGVGQYIDTPVKRYSSGMYVRLAFAVAAHLDSDVLVVDEVLAVGDFEFQKKCIGKMNEVGRTGRTVLFVSHQLELISRLCTRGIVLERGKIAFDGAIKAALDYYYDKGINQSAQLEERLDRSGNLDIKALSWRIESANERVILGQPMSLLMTVEVREAIKDVDFSFAIFDRNQVCVHNFSSLYNNSVVSFPTSGKYEVVLNIPKWQANVGTYSVDMMINKHNILFDSIENIGSFEVDFGDYYGSGKIPDEARLVLTDFDFFSKKV